MNYNSAGPAGQLWAKVLLKVPPYTAPVSVRRLIRTLHIRRWSLLTSVQLSTMSYIPLYLWWHLFTVFLFRFKPGRTVFASTTKSRDSIGQMQNWIVSRCRIWMAVTASSCSTRYSIRLGWPWSVLVCLYITAA